MLHKGVGRGEHKGQSICNGHFMLGFFSSQSYRYIHLTACTEYREHVKDYCTLDLWEGGGGLY